MMCNMKRLSKKKKTWWYVSEEEEFGLHVHCAIKLLLREEKLEVDVRGKKKKREWSTTLKTVRKIAEMVIAFVISVAMGNPTAFLVNLVATDHFLLPLNSALSDRIPTTSSSPSPRTHNDGTTSVLRRTIPAVYRHVCDNLPRQDLASRVLKPTPVPSSTPTSTPLGSSACGDGDARPSVRPSIRPRSFSGLWAEFPLISLFNISDKIREQVKPTQSSSGCE
ncbi:hypothetical protein QJS04_geneDACA011252 [Acorus gramineus]|uniref:Uncharacterized protein n=1 Tax=Acorus gramineus TaxID=55184 RepID=A0AAV9AMY4_ACOGR|nr:hypothetical protein QJS04_geneDACA011252 [Acorus gramineus]